MNLKTLYQNLFIKVRSFFFSTRKIFSFVLVIIVLASIPITTILLKQQQDLRQRATAKASYKSGQKFEGESYTQLQRLFEAGYDPFLVLEEAGYLNNQEAITPQDVLSEIYETFIVYMEKVNDMALEQLMNYYTTLSSRPYAATIALNNGKTYVFGTGEQGNLFIVSSEAEKAQALEAMRLRAETYDQRLPVVLERMENNIEEARRLNRTLINLRSYEEAAPVLERIAQLTDTTAADIYEKLFGVESAGRYSSSFNSARMASTIDDIPGNEVLYVQYFGSKIKTFNNYNEGLMWIDEFNKYLKALEAKKFVPLAELIRANPVLHIVPSRASKLLSVVKFGVKEIGAKTAWPLIFFDFATMGDEHAIYFSCGKTGDVVRVHKKPLNKMYFQTVGGCDEKSRCVRLSETTVQCAKIDNLYEKSEAFKYSCVSQNSHEYRQIERFSGKEDIRTCPNNTYCKTIKSEQISCGDPEWEVGPFQSCQEVYGDNYSLCTSDSRECAWAVSAKNTSCREAHCCLPARSLQDSKAHSFTCETVWGEGSQCISASTYCSGYIHSADNTDCANSGTGAFCCGGTVPNKLESCEELYNDPTAKCENDIIQGCTLYPGYYAKAAAPKCSAQLGQTSFCCTRPPLPPRTGSGDPVTTQSTGSGGGTVQVAPQPTPIVYPKIIRTTSETTCINNEPGKVRFNWTREQSGYRYEIRWTGNNVVTVGDVSEYVFPDRVGVNGFSPNTRITWTVRAYDPSSGIAGPDSQPRVFTVPSSCVSTSTSTINQTAATCSSTSNRPNNCICTQPSQCASGGCPLDQCGGTTSHCCPSDHRFCPSTGICQPSTQSCNCGVQEGTGVCEGYGGMCMTHDFLGRPCETGVWQLHQTASCPQTGFPNSPTFLCMVCPSPTPSCPVGQSKNVYNWVERDGARCCETDGSKYIGDTCQTPICDPGSCISIKPFTAPKSESAVVKVTKSVSSGISTVRSAVSKFLNSLFSGSKQ